MEVRREQALIEKLWGSVGEPPQIQKEIFELTVEHLFGNIWSRPGLKTRDRSMITVVALITLGRERQLRNHMIGALKAGLTREELVEMMIHLAYYAGWPAAMTAFIVANDVFSEADGSNTHSKQ